MECGSASGRIYLCASVRQPADLSYLCSFLYPLSTHLFELPTTRHIGAKGFPSGHSALNIADWRLRISDWRLRIFNLRPGTLIPITHNSALITEYCGLAIADFEL